MSSSQEEVGKPGSILSITYSTGMIAASVRMIRLLELELEERRKEAVSSMEPQDRKYVSLINSGFNDAIAHLKKAQKDLLK